MQAMVHLWRSEDSLEEWGLKLKSPGLETSSFAH